MLMSWLDYQLICVCKGTFKENFYERGQNYKQKKNERIDSNKKHLILKICWQMQLSTNIFEIRKTFSYNYVSSKIKMHGQKYKDYWVDGRSEPHIEWNVRCSSVFRPITECVNSLVISQLCCKLTDHSRHGARNSCAILPDATSLWRPGLSLTGSVSGSAGSPPGSTPSKSRNFPEVHILALSWHCHRSLPNSSSFRYLNNKMQCVF